ncbi:MAG: VanZ family protein [Patescibacteria group bacterium]|jgi:VanZ family protein
MSKKIFNWLAVIAWMGVIYYFSAQPDLKSSLEPFWDYIFRKIAHMAEFFILAYLFFRALGQSKINSKTSLIFAFILSLAYAGFDEWHQSYVAGRVASLKDIGIDGMGILFFAILCFFQKKPNNS